MNKTVLKKFAMEAKIDLRNKIKQKLDSYYVDEKFNVSQQGDLLVLTNDNHEIILSNTEKKKRDTLIKRIENTSFESVVEEATYTWFNRVVAIRYMEVNNILPLSKSNQYLGFRVLSSSDNTLDPEILKSINLTNSDLDINFNYDEYSRKQNEPEKFQYVLLLVIDKLAKLIPQVFGGVTDYIDILMPDNLLTESGIIYKIITELSLDNFENVEVLGWLYQYYNQAEKDIAIKAKKVYKKSEIPFVTQLFTPDWIVKYMVENSLVRNYVEQNKSYLDMGLIDLSKWEYFINDNLNFTDIKVPLEELTFIDPCCGSGHILVYAFEVLYELYNIEGYNKNDIPSLILKNNLYGIDIDDRAIQLTTLALMLKARNYDNDLFNRRLEDKLNVISLQESTTLSTTHIQLLPGKYAQDYASIREQHLHAKEIGSLLLVKENFDNLIIYLENTSELFASNILEYIKPINKQHKLLGKKYDVVVTNPPYLPINKCSINLKNYLEENYTNSKYDLCTAFMNTKLLSKNGMLGMINMNSWMFLSSYMNFRREIIKNKHISSMIHLGPRAFEDITGEVVQTTTFIMCNSIINDKSSFFRLTDFNSSTEKKNAFIKINETKDLNYYLSDIHEFEKIPGSVFGYWASEKLLESFDNTILNNIASPKQGLATGDNNRFLRQWFEVNIDNTLLNSSCVEESLESKVKWYPYNKGGSFRKWYGNNDYVINWYNDGSEIRNFKDEKGKLRSRPQNISSYFDNSITWSKISSSSIAFRYKPYGHIYDVSGTSVFSDSNLNYLLAVCNSNVTSKILEIIAPTLNFEVGQIASLPIKLDNINKVESIVQQNIDFSKKDWDSFETSWDFELHPLLEYRDNNSNKLADVFSKWSDACNNRFNQLKNNEEELNEIFINIYGLQDELTKDVLDKDVTVRRADLVRDIKSLISYAVGCMFGRYSLDDTGLVFAGGEFNIEKYKAFLPDQDNIIPITEEAISNDDIVYRFREFIIKAFGEDFVEENLSFVADALGRKTNEDNLSTIRRYFVNDFYKDHVKLYQKRPIYWQFDSGKNNGFKCLVYMHRYNDNLVPKVRLDYLLKTQGIYENELEDIKFKLTDTLDMKTKKEYENKSKNLSLKISEIKVYDQKIAHVALQRININLDDGVVNNYELFKDILSNLK